MRYDPRVQEKRFRHYLLPPFRNMNFLELNNEPEPEPEQLEEQQKPLEPIEHQDFINMSKRDIQQYFAQLFPDLNMEK